MKGLISLFIVALLLVPFSFPAHAQESEDCMEELSENPITHDMAVYLLSELERPSFDRVTWLVAFIQYANQMDLEVDSCSIETTARLLSWAIEVYRIEGDYYLKVTNKEQYDKGMAALFKSREPVYEFYCTSYPIACRNGLPVTYSELIELLDSPVENSSLRRVN